MELSWSTDYEQGSLGYKVQKRAARSDEWVTVASYEDWAPLNSQVCCVKTDVPLLIDTYGLLVLFFCEQGENGGTYTLLDPDTEVEANGRNTVLCQVLVEVQNRGEVVLQYVGAAGFAILLGGLMTYASFLDPVQ